MHRFFVPPFLIANQRFSSDDSEFCHQLFRVLKLKNGERIILCDNTEHEYVVELTQLNKEGVAGKILEKKIKLDIGRDSLFPHEANEANYLHSSLHLFVPPLKNPARWEFLVEKCTEIGVASFTPLITERTEVMRLRKIDRLKRIIKEAAELSGRTKLPIVYEPVEFKTYINQKLKTSNQQTNFLATLHSFAQPLFSYNLKPKTYNLFLGPVGDFTEQEVQLAIEHGFHIISLGSQVLRTETAAIVGATLLILNQKKS